MFESLRVSLIFDEDEDLYANINISRLLGNLISGKPYSHKVNSLFRHRGKVPREIRV